MYVLLIDAELYANNNAVNDNGMIDVICCLSMGVASHKSSWYSSL